MNVTAIFCVNFILTTVLLLFLAVIYHKTVERLVTLVMKQWNTCFRKMLKSEKYKK